MIYSGANNHVKRFSGVVIHACLFALSNPVNASVERLFMSVRKSKRLRPPVMRSLKMITNQWVLLPGKKK